MDHNYNLIWWYYNYILIIIITNFRGCQSLIFIGFGSNPLNGKFSDFTGCQLSGKLPMTQLPNVIFFAYLT